MLPTKGIMFLSIMDFTDKGIQVIKLTPEFFAKQGWNVHYVVTRDNSPKGSYLYQPIIFPDGVTVHRSVMPSFRAAEKFNVHIIKVIYSQVRDYLSIAKLVWEGRKVLRDNSIDVIYGGGPHGAIAAKILNLFQARNKKKITVFRFYGVWDLYTEIISGSKKYKILLNLATCAALYLRSNLKIITNDGTLGDKALKFIRSSNTKQLRFYVNGIDEYSINNTEVESTKNALDLGGIFSAVCVTRLVSSKRVDFCIRVAAAVIHEFGVSGFRLMVVGDGSERDAFVKLASDLGVDKEIAFIGAVNNNAIKNYLAISDIFLSAYRISNVGNPLLEAIRANKIIFTLNNGDTGNWIKHRENGFIYSEDSTVIMRMAADIAELICRPALRETIKEHLKITEAEKLWTWDQRMSAEFKDISCLIDNR